MHESVLDCLDKPYVFEILEMLGRGDATISEMDSISGWRTLDSRLVPLCEAGIVDIREKTEGRRAKVYRLTRDGHRCLFLMRLSRSIISGEMDLESKKIIEFVDRMIDSPGERE